MGHRFDETGGPYAMLAVDICRRLLFHCHRISRADAPFHRFCGLAAAANFLVVIGLAATAIWFVRRYAPTLYISESTPPAHTEPNTCS